MARKPAQTKKPAAEAKAAVTPEGPEGAAAAAAADAAQAADTAGTDAGAVVADTKDTEGAETADQHADAPSGAPAAFAPGANGGEDGSDLPTDQSPALDRAVGMDLERRLVAAVAADAAPLIPAGTEIEFIGADLALPKADLMVICHRKGGRRRAGMRWAEGETPVSSADFTPFQLAQLRGDPQFTVFFIEKA